MDTLKNRNSPAVAKMLSQIQVLKGEKGDKGDPGYTPVKGKDYFTSEELLAFIEHIRSQVKDGEKGDTGPRGDRGESGYTPVKGVDYFTKAEKQALVSDVLSKIPKDKDVKPEAIVKLVLQELKLPDTKEFISKGELSEFLRRGGFRGGGDTIVAGSGIAININENGQKEVSTTGSGSFNILTVDTGDIDDTNTVFTFASAPSLVIVNGATYRNGSTAMGGTIVISGTTVTLPSPVGTGGDLYALS